MINSYTQQSQTCIFTKGHSMPKCRQQEREGKSTALFTTPSPEVQAAIPKITARKPQ